MATKAQIQANRQNAQKSTGPATPAGKSKSSQNRLSHGFFSSALFIPGENPQDFHNLLADLRTEFQPATPSEQMILEKMVQSQWLSLRAYRLQANALAGSIPLGEVHKGLGVLIRYHQSADRAFLRFRSELLTSCKQRENSEIGFEPQKASEPLETAPDPAPAPPETTPQPEISVPAVTPMTPMHSLDSQVEAYLDKFFNAPLPMDAVEYIRQLQKGQKAA